MIGENVGVDVDSVVEDMDEGDGERDGEGEGEGDGEDDDANVSMVGSDIGSGNIVNMGVGIGAVGINSGGSSVYIKFPASVIVVPGKVDIVGDGDGFPKANVILSCFGYCI